MVPHLKKNGKIQAEYTLIYFGLIYQIETEDALSGHIASFLLLSNIDHSKSTSIISLHISFHMLFQRNKTDNFATGWTEGWMEPVFHHFIVWQCDRLSDELAQCCVGKLDNFHLEIKFLVVYM